MNDTFEDQMYEEIVKLENELSLALDALNAAEELIEEEGLKFETEAGHNWENAINAYRNR